MTESTEPDAADDRARLVGLNHVALEVGDVGDAVDAYRQLFDFELRGRTDTTAFLDMGDQFLALGETDDVGGADAVRHLGLVVDDPSLVTQRLEAGGETGFERLEGSGVDLRDPWGNRLQLVAYQEIQFTKPAHVLDGMGLAGIEKSDSAIEELAEKGMAPDY